MDNLTFFEQFVLMLFIGTPIILLLLAWVLNSVAEMMQDISNMGLEELGGIGLWIIFSLILTAIYF
jgi:hypothetical protein